MSIEDVLFFLKDVLKEAQRFRGNIAADAGSRPTVFNGSVSISALDYP